MLSRGAEMSKYVITGFMHAGKSTCVQRIIENSGRSISGVLTKKVDAEDENMPSAIYMFPAGKSLIEDEAHIVGHCGHRFKDVDTDKFDELGVKYLSEIKPGDLVIIDELGFIEKDAMFFRAKILEVLQGPEDVIAVIKNKPGIEFLEQIKALSGIELITLDQSNRDEIYSYLLKNLSR